MYFIIYVFYDVVRFFRRWRRRAEEEETAHHGTIITVYTARLAPALSKPSCHIRLKCFPHLYLSRSHLRARLEPCPFARWTRHKS